MADADAQRRQRASPPRARGAQPRREPIQRPARAVRRVRYGAGAYRASAQKRLRQFRRRTQLAVALTALLLLLSGHAPEADATSASTALVIQPDVTPDPVEAIGQATGAIRDVVLQFYGFAPRLLIVLVLLALASVVSRFAMALLRRTSRGWERAEAAGAVTRLVIFLLAIVAAVSVLAGDASAVVGSVGLLGLAASWALQTPIESFTGWLLNSFRAYYRVGDRIAVGDVFGDVYRIDVLTTTVWEAGGPGKPVTAAQSTGALITFPNWEVLRSNIVNYSRDFPYVWDEVAVNVANESDLRYAIDVLEGVARRVLGAEMTEAVEKYERLLKAEHLSFAVDEVPRVYVSSAESWTDCTLRYLVPVRTRRAWSSTLLVAITEELNKPEHRDRILPVYPRREVVVRHDWTGAPGAPAS